MAGVQAEQAGRSAAVLKSAQQLGSVWGVALMQMIYTEFLKGTNWTIEAVALAVSAMSFLIGLVISMAARARGRPQADHDATLQAG
ncbi:hypothetical protein [Streptomyces asiaticus]